MVYQAKPIALVIDHEDVIGELYGDYVNVDGEFISNGKFYIRKYFLNLDNVTHVDYRVNMEEVLKFE